VAVREFSLEKPHGRWTTCRSLMASLQVWSRPSSEGTPFVELERQSGKYVEGSLIGQSPALPHALHLRVNRSRDSVH
jgi:hypothetical protein